MKRILVADDSALMRKVLTEKLASGGYTDVMEAASGDEAVSLYLAKKPDLVLLDLMTPRNGMAALKRIMESDPKAKVIMLSAVGPEGAMAEAARLGAIGYLLKPQDEDKLMNAVRKAVDGKKIMIVDDSAFMRALIKKIVSAKSGMEVIEAEDGNKAVEMYKKERPALTLMDVVMPNLNGVDALRQIREIDPAAKIVMISAAGQELVIKEAITLGANDFIVKPFKEEQVHEAIEKALEGK